MAKKRRVPSVLYKLFKNRSKTLAETLLSFIPPPSPSPLQCRCEGSHNCLCCCSESDRMSVLLREDDPSEYRKLVNHCFVVVSDDAPSPPLFDPRSRWFQLQIVRRTIEIILQEKVSAQNVICTGYNKNNHSSIIVEALTSDSWSLLLKRVGDGLMFHLLKYSSIFMPLNRRKHHQVAGNPINELCWDLLKQTSKAKNQQSSSETATKKRKQIEATKISGSENQKRIKKPDKSGNPESFSPLLQTSVDLVYTNIDNPESSMNSLGCNITDSIISVDCSGATQENEVLAVTRSGKRVRPCAWQRMHKRRKLPSHNMCDANCSLPKEKTKCTCSCCLVWEKLQKMRKKVQISKRSMLYKLEPASSILPGKHIINTIRPNVSGANALFKEIFGLSDACVSPQSNLCSHNNNGVTKTTCLYHSLHKLLKILIHKAVRCPRLKLLNKYITKKANEGDSSTFEHTPLLDQQNLCCSKEQVASFIWAVCRRIIPRELLGSSSNFRILRKNISKFIRLRIYEKFSLHECMHKVKISNFPFLSDTHSFCNMSMKRNILQRWIYWLFTRLIVPLLQANFYITESEHGKLEVFFYEKSLWEKLMKQSISSLKEHCYSLLDVNSVKEIIKKRKFGFSRVRFRPKENGIRPLANLKSSSKLSRNGNDFKAVNVILRDLHAALKDVQFKKPEKLGSSVFSYNDMHRNFRKFLSHVKSGLKELPCVYMVVADVRKAYDSIDHDKLLHVMKEVITDDHLLHQTHQFVVSNGYMQVCQYLNLSRQFRSFVHSRSSHSIHVNQGRCTRAMKNNLHFILEQHVKYNVLHIDKKFYLQNVGIPQGSILSSLLCSFYLGHMENTKLVPFLDKVTETGIDSMLLRFIDDFIFISTSKRQARAFFSRLERGFCEYNCNMNKEKFGLSFDVDKIEPPSNRLYFDENGHKFLRWSGLFINCVTLEVQADYTRYLDGHLSSTLTVCWQGKPGHYFKEKMCDYLRPKCHAIFYDSKINSAAVARLNIHQAFLLCAMKFHCYVCDLSDVCSFDRGSYMDIIHNSIRFMYKLMKKRMYSLDVVTDSRPILKVKRREVDWLGLTAYFEVLKRKQSRYTELLHMLESKLNLLDVKRVSPALEFAADKFNSSVLWKIKY